MMFTYSLTNTVNQQHLMDDIYARVTCKCQPHVDFKMKEGYVAT